MNLQGLLNQTEAYVQEEIGAQMRLLEILQRQERALAENDRERLRKATEECEQELAHEGGRAQRRRELLARFARAWNVAPGAVSLASVVARAGEQAEPLARLRDRLRGLCIEARRKGKILASLARQESAIAAELLRTCIQASGRNPEERDGLLVDSEA